MLLVSLAFMSALVLQDSAPEDPGGWEKAKWGMQPEELQSVLKGTKRAKNAFAMQGQPVVKLELRNTTVHGVKCDVQFAFEAATGLAQVNVISKKGTEAVFNSLRDRLAAALGAGTTDETSTRTTVRWVFPTTRVQLLYEDPLRDPMVRANRDRLPYLTPPAVMLVYNRASD